MKSGKRSVWWEARYFVNGTQISVSARTQADCIRKLLDLRNETPQSKCPVKREKHAIIEAQRNNVTFAEWCDKWLKRYKSNNKTQAEMRRQLSRSVLPYIGETRICDVTTEEIESLVLKISTSNTRQKVYDLINGCLRRAVDNGLIAKNPCDPLIRPKHKNKKRYCFKIEEQNAMLHSLPPKYAAAFFFLCSTGLRIGEFLALSTDDFLPDGYIQVNKEADDKGNIKYTTKTSRDRYVPYLPDLLRITRTIACGDIFGTMSYYGVKKAFSVAIRANGLNNVSIHSTRHTFASVCFRSGIPLKAVQEYLGHATFAITADTYAHAAVGCGKNEITEYLALLKECISR